jgi:hypothetical protein
MTNLEARRAEREARRTADTSGRKTPHEDAIARYLAAFAYLEKRREDEEQAHDEEQPHPERQP